MNIRIKPRGLPQSLQRFLARVVNFGVRFDFSINDFFAISYPYLDSLRNGILKPFSNSYAAASLSAVVCMEIFIP